MKKFLFIILFLLPPLTFASNFNDANKAFKDGQYDKAIPLYQDILEENGYSVAVLYNLANSYSKTGDIGRAVLYYQKAKYIDPSNGDITKNLQLLRENAGLYNQEENKYLAIISQLNVSSWAFISLFCLIAITLLLFINRLLPKFKFVTRASIPVLIVAMTLSAFSSWNQYKNWQALVLIDDQDLKISPFDKSESKGILKAGRLVYENKKYDNYIYVKDETGRKGWLENTNIESIINH
ncbi:MAG: tetratricopeptide repeat protein [Desulfotalea sp.]